MPVDKDGRWESWSTRKAREDAEKPAEAEAPVVVDINVPVPKKPQRRGAAAAQAAIAEATGTEVTLETDTTAEAEDGTTDDEQEPVEDSTASPDYEDTLGSADILVLTTPTPEPELTFGQKMAAAKAAKKAAREAAAAAGDAE